jgi:hypothetical protein
MHNPGNPRRNTFSVWSPQAHPLTGFVRNCSDAVFDLFKSILI